MGNRTCPKCGGQIWYTEGEGVCWWCYWEDKHDYVMTLDDDDWSEWKYIGLGLSQRDLDDLYLRERWAKEQ